MIVSSLDEGSTEVEYVYPQPPSQYMPEGAISVGNPASLDIGGVRFAISSVDAISHMDTRLYLRTDQEMGRVGALCKELLDQQTFYPIYPPDASVPFVLENSKLAQVNEHG